MHKFRQMSYVSESFLNLYLYFVSIKINLSLKMSLKMLSFLMNFRKNFAFVFKQFCIFALFFREIFAFFFRETFAIFISRNRLKRNFAKKAKIFKFFAPTDIEQETPALSSIGTFTRCITFFSFLK